MQRAVWDKNVLGLQKQARDKWGGGGWRGGSRRKSQRRKRGRKARRTRRH